MRADGPYDNSRAWTASTIWSSLHQVEVYMRCSMLCMHDVSHCWQVLVTQVVHFQTHHMEVGSTHTKSK